MALDMFTSPFGFSFMFMTMPCGEIPLGYIHSAFRFVETVVTLARHVCRSKQAHGQIIFLHDNAGIISVGYCNIWHFIRHFYHKTGRIRYIFLTK